MTAGSVNTYKNGGCEALTARVTTVSVMRGRGGQEEDRPSTKKGERVGVGVKQRQLWITRTAHAMSTITAPFCNDNRVGVERQHCHGPSHHGIITPHTAGGTNRVGNGNALLSCSRMRLFFGHVQRQREAPHKQGLIASSRSSKPSPEQGTGNGVTPASAWRR